MPIRFTRVLAIAAACALAGGTFAQGAHAEATSRKKTEGCMVSYDGTGALVVKDKKTKKEVTFQVKQAASVLDKEGTVATKNGRKAQLTDLEPNRPIIVYWMQKNGADFATKVDAPDPMDSETGKLDPDIMEDAGCKTE